MGEADDDPAVARRPGRAGLGWPSLWGILAGSLMGWNPAIGLGAFLTVGGLVLAVGHYAVLVLLLLVVRPSLDILSDTPISLGPASMNAPSVVGLSVLASAALYLLLERLRRRRIDWGGTPAAAFALLTGLALLGTLNGWRVLGPSALAPGVRETIRLGTYLALYLGLVNACRTRLGPRSVFLALFAGAVIPIVRGAGQFAYFRSWGLYDFGPSAVPHGRVIGTFYHATSFGLYLAFLILIALVLARREGRALGVPRAIPLVTIPIALFLLVFTFARGAWIFLAVAIVVRALQDPRRILPPLLLLALLGGVVFGPRITARFGDLGRGLDLRQLVQRPSSINSFEWRVYNWLVLAAVAREQPIVGHGTASTGLVNPHRTRRAGQEQTGYAAHSDLIGYAVEYGLLGLAGLLGFYGLLLRWLHKRARRASGLSPPLRELSAIGFSIVTGLLVVGTLSQSPIGSTVTMYGLIALLALVRTAPSSPDADLPVVPVVDTPGRATYAPPSIAGRGDCEPAARPSPTTRRAMKRPAGVHGSRGRHTAAAFRIAGRLGMAGSLLCLLIPAAWAAGGVTSSALRGPIPGALQSAEQETPGVADIYAVEIGRVLEGALIDTVYQVGPGDRFVLSLAGPAPVRHELQVDLEGNLALPDGSALAVADWTLARTRSEVLRRIRATSPRADILFSLIEAREFRAFLTGVVARAGSYRTSGVERVSDLLARSGGPLPNASTRRVRVERRDGTVVYADLQRFFRLGQTDLNPFLRDGDRVIVPYSQSSVEIYGAVHSPGSLEFVPGERFSDLLTLAGGPTAAASLDSLRLVRPGRESDRSTVLVFDFPAEDPQIEPRDQLFVRPQANFRDGPLVSMIGEFNFPMILPIIEGKTRVFDAIRMAGGFTEDAAVDEASLNRTGRQQEQLRDLEFERLKLVPIADMSADEYSYYKMKLREKQGRMTIDFGRVLQDPSHPDNILLERGDVIQAPQLRRFVQVTGQVGNPGNVAFDPSLSVYDYVDRAGGYAFNARKSRITLIRATTGEWLRNPDQDHKPEPGDIVWVPEKAQREFWTIFKDVMLVASQAATVVILVRQVTQ